MTLLAACAPTRFETQSDIPQPLIEKIPVVVGVYMPPEATAITAATPGISDCLDIGDAGLCGGLWAAAGCTPGLGAAA